MIPVPPSLPRQALTVMLHPRSTGKTSLVFVEQHQQWPHCGVVANHVNNDLIPQDQSTL